MGAVSERIQLLATAAAPRLARRQVAAVCDGMAEGLVVVAELLTSELVTNAVVHPAADTRGADQPAITVHIRRTEDRLRVEVSDHDPSPVPTPASPSALLDHGWGLHLVTELATAWGSHSLSVGVGKTVWFEIELAVPGSPGAGGTGARLTADGR